MQIYAIYIYTQVPSPSVLAFIPFWFNRSSAFARSTPRSRSRKWCAKRLRCLDGPWWHWLSKALPKCRIWLHDTHFLFGYVWGSYSFDMWARKPFSCNDLELFGCDSTQRCRTTPLETGDGRGHAPYLRQIVEVSQTSRGDFPWFPWGHWPWGGIRHQRLGQKQRSAFFFSLKVFDIGKLVTCLVRFDSQAIDQVFSSTEYRVMWWTIHRLNSHEPEEFRSFHTSLPRLCIQSRHFTVDNVTVDSLHLKSVKRHCGRGYVLVGHRKCAAFAVLKDDGAVATWGHPDCLVSCPHNRSRTLREWNTSLFWTLQDTQFF